MKKQDKKQILKSHIKSIIRPIMEGKKKSKPTYKSATDIMTQINEDSEEENKAAKLAKIQQEIENINLEIQSKISQPATGNKDVIIDDVKYLMDQKEALEKELNTLNEKKVSKKAKKTQLDTPDPLASVVDPQTGAINASKKVAPKPAANNEQ